MTYDFRIAAADTATMYHDLAFAVQGLVAGEPDAVANMANVARTHLGNSSGPQLGRFLSQCRRRLVLGPFQGRPACIRIRFGEGVCGAAAETRKVQRVDDVYAFPGHIACDSASVSELVIPIVRDGELIAVLDLDSPRAGRFTKDDEAGCIRLG